MPHSAAGYQIQVMPLLLRIVALITVKPSSSGGLHAVSHPSLYQYVRISRLIRCFRQSRLYMLTKRWGNNACLNIVKRSGAERRFLDIAPSIAFVHFSSADDETPPSGQPYARKVTDRGPSFNGGKSKLRPTPIMCGGCPHPTPFRLHINDFSGAYPS